MKSWDPNPAPGPYIREEHRNSHQYPFEQSGNPTGSVERMFDYYRIRQELNDRHNSNWAITEKSRVLTSGLDAVPKI